MHILAKLILLAVVAVAQALAACDDAAMNSSVACMQSINTADVLVKEKYCQTYNSILACYPDECCKDANMTKAFDDVIHQASLGAQAYGLQCTFVCGNTTDKSPSTSSSSTLTRSGAGAMLVSALLYSFINL
jgi:hypothetical protein